MKTLFKSVFLMQQWLITEKNCFTKQKIQINEKVNHSIIRNRKRFYSDRL